MKRVLIYLASGWRGTAWFVGCAALGALFLFSALIPYAPLSVQRIEVIPTSVCGGEAVEVYVTREWSMPGLLFTIEEVEVTSYWRNVATGETYPVASVKTEPDLAKPAGTIVSDVIRQAPRESGTYKLETQYEIRGRAVIAPAYQITPMIESENTVEARDCS